MLSGEFFHLTAVFLRRPSGTGIALRHRRLQRLRRRRRRMIDIAMLRDLRPHALRHRSSFHRVIRNPGTTGVDGLATVSPINTCPALTALVASARVLKNRVDHNQASIRTGEADGSFAFAVAFVWDFISTIVLDIQRC